MSKSLDKGAEGKKLKNGVHKADVPAPKMAKFTGVRIPANGVPSAVQSQLLVPVTISDKSEINCHITTLSYSYRIVLPPKVKKGCGQRKNKRDAAGRARHIELLPYGYASRIALAA